MMPKPVATTICRLRPVISVFHKDEKGEVSTPIPAASGASRWSMGRHFLDRVSKGRDEDRLRFLMEWVPRHDQFEESWNAA